MTPMWNKKKSEIFDADRFCCAEMCLFHGVHYIKIYVSNAKNYIVYSANETRDEAGKDLEQLYRKLENLSLAQRNRR
jgi:hypothetical protein